MFCKIHGHIYEGIIHNEIYMKNIIINLNNILYLYDFNGYPLDSNGYYMIELQNGKKICISSDNPTNKIFIEKILSVQ